MPEYQIRATDTYGNPTGPWYGLQGRTEFYTSGDAVLIREKAHPLA